MVYVIAFGFTFCFFELLVCFVVVRDSGDDCFFLSFVPLFLCRLFCLSCVFVCFCYALC